MICDLCETNSGLTNKNRKCCQIRLIAQMPKARRLMAYERVLKSDGTTALEAMKLEVVAEFKRLQKIVGNVGNAGKIITRR